MNKALIVVGVAGVLALAGVVAFKSTSIRQAPVAQSPSSEDASGAESDSPSSADRRGAELHAIQPLPPGAELDPKKVALGRKLFHETALSKDGTISCASCHDLNHGGADVKAKSLGVGGVEGDINTPTVFNAALNFKQFWDGRAETLEEQVNGPVNDPKEMASSWPEVVAKLARKPEYVELFDAIYGEKASQETISDAIATFERSLLTPNSRFDRFLEGDADALSAAESAGYALFQEIGCITCHQGANLGGNSFQTFGLVRNYFADRGDLTKADYGRFNVTGKERDKFKFKVPTLRNITKTAPYLHDGSAATLEDAVQVMARYQLGHDLEPEEVELIIGFLKTLDGEYED